MFNFSANNLKSFAQGRVEGVILKIVHPCNAPSHIFYSLDISWLSWVKMSPWLLLLQVLSLLVNQSSKRSLQHLGILYPRNYATPSTPGLRMILLFVFCQLLLFSWLFRDKVFYNDTSWGTQRCPEIYKSRFRIFKPSQEHSNGFTKIPNQYLTGPL